MVPETIPFRIAWLVIGFLYNRLSEKEQDELDDWITQSKENLVCFEELTSFSTDGLAGLPHYDN